MFGRANLFPAIAQGTYPFFCVAGRCWRTDGREEGVRLGPFLLSGFFSATAAPGTLRSSLVGMLHQREEKGSGTMGRKLGTKKLNEWVYRPRVGGRAGYGRGGWRFRVLPKHG